MTRSTRRAAVFVFLALAALCHARALERITLQNGFSYDCARTEAADATHTRLFLAASSYIDIPTAEITGKEALPDSPPPQKEAPGSLAIPVLLAAAGVQHNIDVALLASLVHAESSGHAHAVSRVGAQGLMQLMPATARSLGVTDAFAPDQNINGGSSYLDALLTRYHDNLALALAAYNAGPGAVDRYHGIPPFRETRAYVARVMAEFRHRKEAMARTAHPTLTASR